ncbi:MAG: excinuclease ABC subunit UvrC, partial [Candidatus Ranarchaeia archaeon]
SYFRNTSKLLPRTKKLVNEIISFDTIIVDTELESLMLECNLIKKHRPKYNIRLNDDTSFLYLKLTTNEKFPKILTVRRIVKDNATYYGPHPSSRIVRKTLLLIRKLFKLRTCNIDFEKRTVSRPCLDYHINLCSAPCVGLINQEDYLKNVKDACSLLNGKLDNLLEKIAEEMDSFSETQEYEKAAQYRDQIKTIQNIRQKQRIHMLNELNQDILGIHQEGALICVQIMFIRNGNLVGQSHFYLDSIDEYSLVEYLNEFIKQYYLYRSYFISDEKIPKQIIIFNKIPELDIIKRSFEKKYNSEVSFDIASNDREKRLIELANKNAKSNLQQKLLQPNIRRQFIESGLKELKESLKLKEIPLHIEGVDISTIQGTDTVGSLVVFKNGEPDKKEYRRFKIKGQKKNDYDAISEVVKRRISRLIKEQKRLPDLLLIDGGKGQLNAALKSLSELGVTEINLISIAKRQEEIFEPYSEYPIKLKKTSKGSMLLQRVRDESHRFAVNYHRKLRQIRLTHNQLEEIQGLSKVRIRQLLIKFGSINKLKEATIDEIIETPMISKKLAQRIQEFLNNPDNFL